MCELTTNEQRLLALPRKERLAMQAVAKGIAYEQRPHCEDDKRNLCGYFNLVLYAFANIFYAEHGRGRQVAAECGCSLDVEALRAQTFAVAA